MIVVIGAGDLSAHRRDELLQAARIAVAADRIGLELSLTPGIAVADDVIASIDRDGDGVLSADEQRRYAERVWSATELKIDGQIVRMEAGASTFPAAGDLHDGDRSIEFRAVATLPGLSAGRHEVAFTNDYRSDISVYLANALKPDSGRVVIASQHRDSSQRTLAIDFTIDGNRLGALPWLFGSGAAAWLVVRRRLLPVIG